MRRGIVYPHAPHQCQCPLNRPTLRHHPRTGITTTTVRRGRRPRRRSHPRPRLRPSRLANISRRRSWRTSGRRRSCRRLTRPARSGCQTWTWRRSRRATTTTMPSGRTQGTTRLAPAHYLRSRLSQHLLHRHPDRHGNLPSQSRRRRRRFLRSQSSERPEGLASIVVAPPCSALSPSKMDIPVDVTLTGCRVAQV